MTRESGPKGHKWERYWDIYVPVAAITPRDTPHGQRDGGGRIAVDGETLRDVLGHARELPDTAEITAMETAALSEAGKDMSRSEIRALAVTAIAQLGQIAQKITHLAALLGGESAGNRS
jgi:hypothetical protein